MAKQVFHIKKGDRLPAIKATLEGPDGKAVDLTDAASFRFLMEGLTPGTALLDSGPTAGRLVYFWEAGETDTIGAFKAEFEVTWNDGRVQTFPNSDEDRIEVVIYADLG